MSLGAAPVAEIHGTRAVTRDKIKSMDLISAAQWLASSTTSESATSVARMSEAPAEQREAMTRGALGTEDCIGAVVSRSEERPLQWEVELGPVSPMESRILPSLSTTTYAVGIPASPLPATVRTSTSIVTRRTALLPLSTTRMIPSLSRARRCGWLKRAAWP